MKKDDQAQKDKLVEALAAVDAQLEAEKDWTQDAKDRADAERRAVVEKWEAGRKWSSLTGQWMTKEEHVQEQHQEELRLARAQVNIQHILIAFIAGVLVTLAVLAAMR